MGSGTAGIGGSRSLLLTTISVDKVVNASNFNIDSHTLTLNSASQLNFTTGSLMSTITNINSGATLTLGSTASTSTTTNITGSLILGSSALSGTTQGQSDGTGTVRFTENNILGGIIGTSANSLNLVTIDDGKTVNAGTRNIDSNFVNVDADSTLTMSSGTLTAATTLKSGSILNLGTGILTGSVNGNIAGNGVVNFVNTVTLSANSALGQSLNLAAVNIANTITLTVNTSIAASDINIGNGISGTLTLSGSNKNLSGTINVGNGSIINVTGVGNAINGDIIGTTDDDGTLNISQSLVSNGELGTALNSLTAITVSNGAILNTATKGNNIDSTGVTVTGSNSTLTLGSGTVILGSNNLLLASTDSILNVGSGQIIGTIQGSSDSRGTVNFDDNYVFAGNFGNGTIGVGGTHTLFETNINAAKSVIVNSFNLDSTTVTLNAGSSLIFTSGSLITTAAHLNYGSSLTLGTTASTATTVNVDSNSSLNLSSGILTGTIQGMTDGTGTVNLTENYTLAGIIGSGINSLDLVGISSGKAITANIRNINSTNVSLDTNSSLIFTSGTLTTLGGKTTLGSGGIFNLGNDINANTISIGGRMNFGSSAMNIIGNIVGTGFATLIDFGSASHVITGNLTTVSGNSLGTSVSVGNAGNIMSTGIASIDANTKLLITISQLTNIANGTTYNLVSGNTGSTISAISDANINANSSGTNSYGGHTFTTSQIGNKLFLLISSPFTTTTSSPSLITNASLRNAYNNIIKIDNAQGKMLSFQQYLDSSASDSEKSSALKSVTPQTDNSGNVVIINIVNTSVNVAEKRLESLRNDMPSGFSSGDETQNSAFWVQGFSSSIKQNNMGNGEDGYKADSHGISLGTEKEFINSSSHIGFSGSYADSKSISIVGQKDIKSDSYQVNLYSGTNFGKLFVDGVAGFSWNEYSSARKIPSVSASTQAEYSGQTYIGRLKTGWRQPLGKGFTITPVIMGTYAQNEISQYDEKGAGTLNLHVSHNSNRFIEARAGTVLEYVKVTSKDCSINPQIRISYGRDFFHQKQDSNNTFVGQTTSFQTEAPNVYQASWKFGGGINVINTNSITMSLDYNRETKHHYRSNTLSARINYNF